MIVQTRAGGALYILPASQTSHWQENKAGGVGDRDQACRRGGTQQVHEQCINKASTMHVEMPRGLQAVQKEAHSNVIGRSPLSGAPRPSRLYPGEASSNNRKAKNGYSGPEWGAGRLLFRFNWNNKIAEIESPPKIAPPGGTSCFSCQLSRRHTRCE